MATRFKVTKNTDLVKALESDIEAMVTRVFELDCLIENYAHQLNRAQPLLSGKVCVVFKNQFSHSANNERIYFKKPCWGRLVKRKSGGWLFRDFNRKENFAMNKIESYSERIQSMRVGQNFKTDYTVRRLIARICDMMDLRERVFQIFAPMRKEIYQAARTSESVLYNFSEELDVITKNIEMDWLNNANECYRHYWKEVKKASDAVVDEDDEADGNG
jgi:hypothetical protein